MDEEDESSLALLRLLRILLHIKCYAKNRQLSFVTLTTRTRALFVQQTKPLFATHIICCWRTELC